MDCAYVDDRVQKVMLIIEGRRNVCFWSWDSVAISSWFMLVYEKHFDRLVINLDIMIRTTITGINDIREFYRVEFWHDPSSHLVQRN